MAQPVSILAVDAGTGSVGFIEFKAAGTTQAKVVGGGFGAAEVVTLRVATVSSAGQGGRIILGTATANAVGAFETTLNLTDANFAAGTVHTLDAFGTNGNNAAVGFAIADKVATD
ncbi:MAG: hypothetical protein O3C10_06375 [Chloroflexi bacterium]|nr:hypothetical protein [Chloroflexota bacterium]